MSQIVQADRPTFALTRRGGIRFLRAGRLNLSCSISRHRPADPITALQRRLAWRYSVNRAARAILSAYMVALAGAALLAVI